MSILIQKLLDTDVNKFNPPEKIIEVPRISKMVGETFKIKLKQLPTMLAEEIEEAYLKVNAKGEPSIKMSKMVDSTLKDAVYDVEDNKPLFYNDDLKKQFGCKTPIELMNKILLPAEKTAIFKEYNDLSGENGKDIVKEIKKR